VHDILASLCVLGRGAQRIGEAGVTRRA
jgi:hypothetical protein